MLSLLVPTDQTFIRRNPTRLTNQAHIIILISLGNILFLARKKISFRKKKKKKKKTFSHPRLCMRVNETSRCASFRFYPVVA